MGFLADAPINPNIDVTADSAGKKSIVYTNASGVRVTIGAHEIGARYIHDGREFFVQPTGVVSVREIIPAMAGLVEAPAFVDRRARVYISGAIFPKAIPAGYWIDSTRWTRG
jgi:hypothetical protein